MQSISWCKHYTENKNPNKTCKNEKRCLLWSDECHCYEYEEQKEAGIYNLNVNIEIMRKMSKLSLEQEDICNDCLCSNMNFPDCSECEYYKEAKANEQI